MIRSSHTKMCLISAKICLVFAVVLSISIQNADASNVKNWDNPGEKYQDAYKTYLEATCPIGKDNIQHFVYFARNREGIVNHSLLKHPRFSGAQIMYAWAQLEPTKDNYDFSKILHDYNYLKSRGKKLFLQLQDATFNPKYKGIPSYLFSSEYDGGVALQVTDSGESEGWVAKRWNKAVQARFALLLNALGNELDGKIAGINLQETSITIVEANDKSFSPPAYAKAIKANMSSLNKAFPTSTKLQYANFMPGEWLPWEDKGFLRSVYQHGENIGVGLGSPDLMVQRKGQLNHPITLMHEHRYRVPLGIAIQDGNYLGETNSDKIVSARVNKVPMLHAFAQDFLKVQYMFWVDQKPYFEEDVLSCFKS